MTQYFLKFKKIKDAEVKNEKMRLDKVKLLEVLKEKGKHFDVVLKNNPEYEDLKEIYSILFEDTSLLIKS